MVIAPPGDAGHRETTGFSTDAAYIRIKGFAIIGGNTGVRIGDTSHHVIVEDNFVSGYGDNGAGIELGGKMFGDAYSPTTSVRNVTVQRNTVHVTTVQSADRGGIESLDNQGGHVIRHNTVRFLHDGAGNHGEDCIIHIENLEFDDGYRDTDIYGNFCYDATDDGIELDSNNMNTRVWDNVIVGANVGFSIGPSGVGPTYVFRNLVYNLARAWTRCIGIKEGRSSSGHVFFYHNTFYAPVAACQGDGFVLADSAGPPSQNIVLKNNIFWFAERGISISGPVANDIFADYNLYHDEDGGVFGKYGSFFYDIEGMRATVDSAKASLGETTGFEAHGISADPLFADPGLNDFTLLENSPAVDAGVVIQGFNDALSPWPFAGADPDIGAFELGGTDLSPAYRFGGGPSGSLPEGTNSTTLTASTDRLATCRYSQNPATPYTSMSDSFPQTGSRAHAAPLSGLSDGTAYAFYVRCNTADEVVNEDDYVIEFSVANRDTSPPAISDIAADGDISWATLAWTTDDESTSLVRCGTSTSSLVLTDESAALVTAHSMQLGGLAPGTKYYYQLESCNRDGLCSLTALGSFSTLRSTEFAPGDDAFVAADYPDANYGSATSLEVDGQPVKWTYLKFDVSGIPGRIESARIKLHNVDPSVAGGEIYEVGDITWSESLVTWNTRPSLESVPLDSLGPVEPGNVYGFDVTAAVTGGGSYSFAISPGSTNGADYTSKEGSNPPTLEVKYEPVSSSTSTVPQVTSVSPARGSTEGGTPVTIVGAAFAEGDRVTFDGVTASEVAVANAEIITAITPAHSPGPVDIAVRSVDGLMGTLTGGFTYSEPPVADSGGPYGGAEGAPVSFDASGSYDPDGDPLTYSWNFGDGSVGGGISPNHAYSTGGTYNVTVVVSDGVSSTWTSTTATIIEVNEPPIASIGGPYRGAPGVELTFDGSGSFDPDGDTLTYSWYFGDGSAGIGVSPSHTYAKSGDYAVELVVNDGTIDSVGESSDVVIVAIATAVEMRVRSSKDDAEESSSGKVSYTSRPKSLK